MDLGALAWVERSNKIMIERGEGISFNGLESLIKVLELRLITTRANGQMTTLRRI
jgi:hypothetical protein